MLGVEHRLDDTRIAALSGKAVEVLLYGDRVRGHLLRGRVVPPAEHFDDVPLFAALIQGFMDSRVAVIVDRRAGDAAHFEDLAPVWQMLVEPLRPKDTKPLLVDVNVDRVLGVEGVVERDEHYACFLRSFDDRLERFRILGVSHDRVVTGIDEVVDRGDLRRDVVAGRDDLEFLELGGDFGLRRVGFGCLDHLDAPGVGHESVGEGDAVRPFLGGELEVLGLVGPGHKTGRVGGRAGHNFGSGGECRRREGASGAEHRAADGGYSEMA
jgi:hypothetical protein